MPVNPSRSLLLLLGLSASCALSCSAGPVALGVPPQCNPLRGDDPRDCALPWPSSTYEVADPTTVTGFRVAIPPGVLPANDGNVPIDPGAIDREDGFSATGPAVVHFRQGVSPTGLPTWTNPAISLDASSPTQILDLAGHRQLQFSEVDVTSNDPARTAVFIRPMKRLQPKTAYVVVLRRNLLDAQGHPLPVPAGMQALLDGTPTDNARLEALRPSFEKDVRPALAAAGLAPADVLLAWEYTTASDESLTANITSMRDQALAAIGDGSSVPYAALTFEPNYGNDGTTFARVTGTFRAPCFLTKPTPAGTLDFDASGKPKMNGTYLVNFAVLIPAQAATATAPLTVVVFGHGLLGNGIDTSSQPFFRQMAHKAGTIMAFTDWQGLSTPDITQLGVAMGDINMLPSTTGHLQQAVVNTMVLLRMVRSSLARDPRLLPNGMSLFSPTVAYYAGGSLGGIMGAEYMSFEPDVQRGLLNVPGGNWSLLIQRSADWPDLDIIFSRAYPDGVDQALILAYVQSQFDYADPATTAPYLLAGSAPLTVPPKLILMQEGHYDMQVTNLATEFMARTMGLPLLTPTVEAPYGLTPAQGPLASALCIYELMPKLLPNVTDALNSQDNGVHTHVYLEPAADRQLLDFLQPAGQAVQECSGTAGCLCYPPAPAMNACQ